MITTPKKLNFKIAFLKEMQVSVLVFLLSFTACQSPEQNQADTVAAEQTPTTSLADSLAQKERRPAPEFHRIPTDMAQERVYVCDDANADVFHTQYDCELLAACKTVKKNVTIIRAVEDYGRYNCDICSKDLAVIFDDQQVIQKR
ncbi:hypothetical protein FVR03_06960 [Pontibacter qinzhouensis]|uniref:Uncharacterized protein n=1 Tax=Pontibacter qinzhouensis TaxID=2603253 RepID=A0A5C8K9J6_9BACT|nr:hypothetical protein [Pontibacter qinzhouensis]TXK49116.1 hypothetical protein FVR03_06960 [Pontibacter qinzhouensis]